MRNKPVSVCMATYNGIDYIVEQVESIIPQLISGDELLISDDGSVDGTMNYLRDLEKRCSFVRVIKGPGRGANSNFFFLFNNAINDIIFVSDQDDIWFPNKIEYMVSLLESNPNKKVALHMDIVKNVLTEETKKCIPAYHGIIRNLARNSYSGHRMAFKKEILNWFMQDITICPAYDQYIGLLAEKHNVGVFSAEILDYHLIHNNNVSKPLSILEKIRIRLQLLKCIIYSK